VLVSAQERSRIAFNVKSQVEPSTLLYYMDEDFDHPILKYLPQLPNDGGIITLLDEVGTNSAHAKSLAAYYCFIPGFIALLEAKIRVNLPPSR